VPESTTAYLTLLDGSTKTLSAGNYCFEGVCSDVQSHGLALLER